MNAYELANWIESSAYGDYTSAKDAANMLRQQADRIAELEKDLEGCEYFLNKTKPLSDEEILEIKTLMEINYGCVPPLEYAWAIEEKHGIK